MSFTLAATLIAPLSGLVVGLSLNRLIKHRTAGVPHPWNTAAITGAPVTSGGRYTERAADTRRGRWRRTWSVLNVIVLTIGALALAVDSSLQDAFALSQALLLFFLLYALALLDLMTLTVEAPLVVAGLLLRLGSVWVLERERALDLLAGMLVGAGLFYLIGFLYETLRGRQGLGEGDPAVMGLIGAFVAWQGVVPVVMLSTVMGLVVGFPLLLLVRRPLDTPLPFVPFLCFGGLLVYLARSHDWLLWYGSLYIP